MRLVVGKLLLAAAGLAVIMFWGLTWGTSAAAGAVAGSVPRALLSRDELDEMTQGTISDGFDRHEDGAMFGPRREDEDQSVHGLAKKTHGHYRAHMKEHAVRYFSLFVFQTAIMFGVAWILKRYAPACLPQESVTDHDPEVGRLVFAYGLFDEKEFWSEDLMLCMLSFCCTGIQWANNVSNPKVGIYGSFWVALSLSALNSYELNALTHGVSFMFWVVIAVYARQGLRKRYGLESGSMMSLAQDIFAWCCCCRCAAAQEARQVEHVRILDIRNPRFGEATQLQVDEYPPSGRRTLLRPNDDGAGRENTANTDISDL
jgi:Cys-rich protein (TIGR01571 family)